jgi:acetyl-CoA carboxylase carboxyltransferase component
MSWEPEVNELRRRQREASKLGGEEAIARQHAAGRFTVRERLDRLLDPGSLQEFGSTAGSSDESGEFRPANFVMGLGEVDGRRVIIGGEDFTVRGGAEDGGGEGKWLLSEQMAEEWKLPIVRLIEGTGGSVRSFEEIGRTYVPTNPGVARMVRLMGKVPVVSAVLGSVAGWASAKAVTAHWTVMVKDTSQILIAGPSVVEQALATPIKKEELGGYQVHTANGVADNLAMDEEDCFRQIRAFLSYLPPNVWTAPPRAASNDPVSRREEALLTAIPRSRRRQYDVRRILALVVDDASLFEIGPGYGRSLVTAFARLDGYPVGIIANDCRHLGGALDANGCDKLTRFVDLCDTFSLPVVNFVDQPGFMIGLEAERSGTLRRGMRALAAVEQSTTPWVSVVIRRCFGVAGAGHGRDGGLNLRYAWPSAEWGSLPLEAGVQVAYRREIANAPDPAARRTEIMQRFIEISSPFRTAEGFGVEEIIDPRDTRPLLCRFAAVAYDSVTEHGPKTRMGVRP